MANNDTPFGLKAVDQTIGAPFSAKTRKYYAPASYATNLFKGDAVTLSGTANTSVITTGAGQYGIGSIQEVNATTVGDGNAITGIIESFDAQPSSLDVTYGAASTLRVMNVWDDPSTIFEIQADGTLTAAQVGLNAVLIATHSGSTVTGYSGLELDTTSDVPAADASNQLTIIGFVDRPDNDPSSANAKVLVRINNHTNVPGAIGI